MERLTTEEEAAAERKDMKTVLQITRKLRGDSLQNQDFTAKAKDGSTITEEQAKLERWREQQHFNLYDPPTHAYISEAEQGQKIELGPNTVQEAKDAFKRGNLP